MYNNYIFVAQQGFFVLLSDDPRLPSVTHPCLTFLDCRTGVANSAASSVQLICGSLTALKHTSRKITSAAAQRGVSHPHRLQVLS
jgi:hypothetical protein